MKFIITENQNKKLFESLSDLIYNFFETKYPNFVDMYSESKDETEICSDEDCLSLIFYYEHDSKTFYFPSFIVDELYEITDLEYFNLFDDNNYENRENRENFNELVKVFSKRHFGLIADKVYLHWYT